MAWNYTCIAIAILFEVAATTALKETHGFTRIVPSVLTVIGYALAFYFLSLPLRNVPIGVVYAIWCGGGIILITAVGWSVYGQALDLPALSGMALISAGVLVINLYSKTIPH